MGKLTELQDALLAAVAEQILEFGFVFKRRTHEYRRKTPFGWLRFHINMGTFGVDGISAVTSVGIRFDQVQKHLDTADPDRKPREAREYSTFGVHVGELVGKNWLEWELNCVDNAGEVATEVVKPFAEAAIPYFNKYSDLRVCYQALLDDAAEAKLLCRLPSAHAKSVITLAYLFDERERFEEQAALHRKRLQELKDPNLWFFDRLQTDLRKRFELRPTSDS